MAMPGATSATCCETPSVQIMIACGGCAGSPMKPALHFGVVGQPPSRTTLKRRSDRKLEAGHVGRRLGPVVEERVAVLVDVDARTELIAAVGGGYAGLVGAARARRGRKVEVAVPLEAA